MRKGRANLVAAVREAYAQGMTQREIASAINRSQPEVNRLIRFHGDTPGGLAVRKARKQILAILAKYGMSNPRVFGSVARGEDTDDSDVDLLVTVNRPVGLVSTARAESELSKAVGRPVDLVFDSMIRPDLEKEIKESAVPL